MGGSTNSSNNKNSKLRSEQIVAGDTGFNSLVPDAHVDPNAEKSNSVHRTVKDIIS